MADLIPAEAAQIELLETDAARSLVGALPPPSALVVEAVLDHIDEAFARFINLSPLLFISSRDANGMQEVSPRGDPAGSFRILDAKTLAVADRPGNNRIDTLKNILDNPDVGLIFVIPGIDHTVRISGKARISVQQELLDSLTIAERVSPRLALVIEVEKAHLHCAKAFRRARIWEADSQVPANAVPTFTRTIADQVKMAAEKRQEFEARIARANVEGLWESKAAGQ